MGNEHRYLPPSLLVKDLFGFEICWIEIDLWLSKDRAFARGHVVTIDRRRCCEPGKGIERFLSFGLPPNPSADPIP